MNFYPRARFELTNEPPFTERRTGHPQIQNQGPGHPPPQIQNERRAIRPRKFNTLRRLGHPPARGRPRASSCSQKSVHIDSGFAENRTEGSLRHVAGVMWDCNFSSGLRMTPDFVTACATAVEAKAECAETPRNFTVAKSRQAAHQGIRTGTRNSRTGTCPLRNAGGRGSPCSRQDSTIFRARL